MRSASLGTLLACLGTAACASTSHPPAKRTPVLRTIAVEARAARPAIEPRMGALLADAADGDEPHRGLAALFIDGGEDHFASVGVRGHGDDNVGSGVIDRSTIFPIGSISKTFTGLLLAEALRRGEIANLQDAVAPVWKDKLPFPRGATRDIRWEDLATHRAGLPFFPPNWTAGSEKHRAGYTMDAFRAYLASAKLESEPGTTALYGNTGYALLGMSLAEIAGRTFPDLLRERVLRPLGMTGSDYPDRDEPPPANYVEGWGTNCQPQPWRWDPTPMGPCCVIRSSLTDFARLARVLMTPNTTWSEDFQRMIVPRAEAPWGLGEYFGLGVTVSPAKGLVWKDGQVEGVRSFFLLEPSKKRALVLVASSYRVDIHDLAFRMWDLVTDDPSGRLTASQFIDAAPSEAKAVNERLANDMVVEAVEAPASASPGQNVTVSVYLRCEKASPRPYRFYSDLWMGRDIGRIIRTQRLANGATCETDGKRIRHDVNYTLPRSARPYKADLWIGLTGVDHAADRPDAAASGSQRKRIARIVVGDWESRPPVTWGTER